MPVSSSHSDLPCQHCQVLGTDTNPEEAYCNMGGMSVYNRPLIRSQPEGLAVVQNNGRGTLKDQCGRRECSVVFRVQLDADLLHTLVSIYPEWFTTATGGSTTSSLQQQQQQQSTATAGMQPVSPPKAEVDDSPLHNAMDKNKESLKVKLMLRRPINQLVAQGIMPPLKTPPGYHEQRQKLERAKMGDLLKAKIQQRPDREELVRQHILEDVGHVDPSLAERQRQLKKCRLADALNDQLSHRPGPLELIKKNILHTEEPIERAIKEGALEFKATSEGTATKPTHPDHYMLDEDSSSLSPPPPPAPSTAPNAHLQILADEAVVTSTTQPPPAPPLPPAQPTAQSGNNGTGIVTVLLTPTAAIALPAGAATIYSSSNGRSPQQSQHQQQTVVSSISVASPAGSISRDKTRKKSKAKAQPKARTIKFHEYKGPPNAQKNNTQNSTPVETSYELLLQQQQLFLQWQLEWQHKYPRLLPASQKPNSNNSQIETTRGNSQVPPPPPLPAQSPPPIQTRPLTNLEDMKVSDLKAELKKRNLPVSGAKPQLIERLKPFSESATSNSSSAASSSSSAASSSIVSSQHTQDDSIPSVCSVSSSQTVSSSCGAPVMMDTTESPSSPSPTSPTSTTSTALESTVGTSTVAPDDIIRDQQRKIDMLQRQLNMQNHNNTFQQEPVTNAKASLAAFLQQQHLNQLALQQSQQHLITTNNNNNNIKLGDIKVEENSQDGRTVTLPNFKGTFMTNGSTDLLNHVHPQEYLTDNKHVFQIKPDINKQMIGGDCEEVKSQIVDDVLEILIKNGELPAIAAAEPVELSSLHEMDSNDLMEVDTDWLDSLMCGGSGCSGGTSSNTGDPLLGGPPSPFDLLIDDDFKLPQCGATATANDWDRMDFAI